MTTLYVGNLPFNATEADVKALFAGIDGIPDGISVATAPIYWSPETGVELLVTTGRAAKTGFIVALWTMPEGRYRFASSFLLLNDPGTIVLAYDTARRKELRWSSCWGCTGQQGAVSLRDDGRVVIVQY